MPRIFISYRREDSAGHTGRLRDRLVTQFGHNRIFMDIDTIDPGAYFTQAIKDAVASCDVLIAVIGKQWLTGTDAKGVRRLDNPKDFVRQEIAAALAGKTRVIPVLVQGATMPNEENLPEDLRSLAHHNAIEISDVRWDYDVERLAKAIQKQWLSRRALMVTTIGLGVAALSLIVYVFFSHQWETVPGMLAQDIGVGAKGHVWTISTKIEDDQSGYEIAKWSGSGWTAVKGKGGGGMRIAVDPQGQAWRVTSEGLIYKRLGEQWLPVSRETDLPVDTGRHWITAQDIGIGANGTVWIIGEGHNKNSDEYQIFQLSGRWWQQMPGGAWRIAVDPQGFAWVVTTQHKIGRYNGNTHQFEPIEAPPAWDIGIGANNAVWIIGPNSGGHQIWKWDEAKRRWDPIDGDGVAISVDQNGNPWVVRKNGEIRRRTTLFEKLRNHFRSKANLHGASIQMNCKDVPVPSPTAI